MPAALAQCEGSGYSGAVNSIVVIPARWAATRLPGKPLADLQGRPLVVHVLDRARKAERVSRVLVATDDPRIVRVVTAAGGEAVLTPSALPSGSDRCAWAVSHLGLCPDAVINLQGDMPLVHPADIDRLVAHLERTTASVATGWRPLPEDEAHNPARVKVVASKTHQALYFSRAAVPFAGPWRVHVGVYAFRTEALFRFTDLSASPLQQAEDLEQLRLLENNVKIDVIPFAHDCPSIDTPADLDALRVRLAA